MESERGDAAGADVNELKAWLERLRIRDPDADRYAYQLGELGFDDVQAVYDDIREEDMKFMKTGHRIRIFKEVSAHREPNGGSPSRHYADPKTAFARLTLSPTSLFSAPEPPARTVSYNLRPTPPFVEREAVRMPRSLSASPFPNQTPRAAVARSWVESPSFYVNDSSEDHGESMTTSSIPSSNASPMASPLSLCVYPNSDVANWGPSEVMQWLRQFESLAAHQEAFGSLSGADLLSIQSPEDAQSLGIHFRPHQRTLLAECRKLRHYVRVQHPQQLQQHYLQQQQQLQQQQHFHQQQQHHGAVENLSRRGRKGMGKGRLAHTPRMLSNEMYDFVEEDENADADSEDEHTAYEDEGAKPAAFEEIRRKPELRLDLDTIGQAEGPAYEDQLSLLLKDDVRRRESDESVGRGSGDVEARYRRQDIVFLGDLGRGASGCVKKAIHVPSMSLVAVKVVTVDAAEKRQRMVQELRALRSLRTGDDSCIVQFLDAFIDVTDVEKSTVCIVLEYMNAGTLQDLVDSKVPVNEHMLAAVAMSVLKGLKLMHAHKKIHRDIKPSNILLNRSGQIKISDFGVSTELADESVEKAQTFTGTLLYMSPERIMAQAHSTACDIWSLGLCLVTLALGRFPLSITDMSYWGVVQAVQDGPSPALPKESFSQDLCHFVEQCLQKEPEERPSAQELLTHPFLKRCTLQLSPELEPETTEGSEGRLAALATKVMEHRIMKLGRSAQHAKAVPPPLKSWERKQLERLAEQLGMPLDVVERTFEQALQNANRELERYYRYRRRAQKETEEAKTTPDAASQRRLWAKTPDSKDVDVDAETEVDEVGRADRSLDEISSSSERSDGILSALVLPFRARRKPEAK